MHSSRIANIIFASIWLGLVSIVPDALAQEKLRIGIIGQLSGPFAIVGKQYQQGIQAYMATYGTRVGGREVEVIYRDVGGANASVAKRLAEELIVRDQVSILGGFYLSPEAIAVASVLTETKTPAVVFNSAAKTVTDASPYIVHPNQTQFQLGFVEAQWAIKNGFKSAYVSVSDYAPGYELLASFRQYYTALGGEILGEDKISLNTVDYSPYVERVARAKPSLFMMFIPSGAPSVNLVKALAAQGMTGRKDLAILGEAQLDENSLSLFDDSVVGMYDALFYAVEAPGDENKKYKEAQLAKFGTVELPNYFGASAWDGMHVIYQMIRSQQGKKFDGTTAVKAALGYKFNGAKGPQTIEADTRNTTGDFYIRRAIKGPNGKLKLEVADVIRNVKSLP